MVWEHSLVLWRRDVHTIYMRAFHNLLKWFELLGRVCECGRHVRSSARLQDCALCRMWQVWQTVEALQDVASVANICGCVSAFFCALAGCSVEFLHKSRGWHNENWLIKLPHFCVLREFM
eukprot:jgi/Botrbrau1/10427/Bobra.0133s0034.1